MSRCPQCQHENPPGARFCSGCGARAELACAGCGQVNPPGSRFGNGCGVKLGDPAPAGPGDYGPAIQTGLRALAIGEALADIAIQVVANGQLGGVYVGLGDCRKGVRHGEAALALIPERLAQERFGHSNIQGSFMRFTLGMALGGLGRFAEASGRLREARHIAEEAGHVFTLLWPLFGLGTLAFDQGDFVGAAAPLARGLDLCRTREVPSVLHNFAWGLGAAYHRTGRRAEGVALMEDAARGAAEQNTRRLSWWACGIGSLGAAYLLDGRLADATRIAQDWLATARQRGQRGEEGQLLRLLGDIAAHPDRGEVDTAVAHYHHALALAEELGLRPLLAHCHLGLGALYRRTGKREQAREQLTTAGTLFGEMDMRFWRELAEMEMRGLP
jgi:tetratricopeptide (TPR) repeat protein